MSFTCTLFSDKGRCFNESKRALYGNFLAFSRYERTHPNFVSAAGIEILDCKLAAPLSFCRSFGPRFCVHWAQNEARSYFGVFRSVRRIVVFLELVFTPMAIDKKKRSPRADWTELF